MLRSHGRVILNGCNQAITPPTWKRTVRSKVIGEVAMLRQQPRSFRFADRPGTPFIHTTPSVMTLIRRGACDGFGSPRNRRQTTLAHGALVYKGRSFWGTAKLEIPALLEILFAEDTITLRN